jgi:hypothetical protein
MQHTFAMLKKREACEIVLWAKPLPETQEEIMFFEQTRQDDINKALGKRVTASWSATPDRYRRSRNKTRSIVRVARVCPFRKDGE